MRQKMGLIPTAIMRVMSRLEQPVRAKDIHCDVEEELGDLVSYSTVKAALARGSSGQKRWLRRSKRGWYELLKDEADNR